MSRTTIGGQRDRTCCGVKITDDAVGSGMRRRATGGIPIAFTRLPRAAAA